jgi:hypothetical protein
MYNLLFFSLQNAVCFTILTYLVPVLFTFYIQGVLKLKKNNSGAKRLRIRSNSSSLNCYFSSIFHTFYNFFLVGLSSWLKQIVRNHLSHFISTFEGKYLSTYAISTTVTGLGTSYVSILAVT